MIAHETTAQEPTSAPAEADAPGMDSPPSAPEGAPAEASPESGKAKKRPGRKPGPNKAKPGQRRIGPAAREEAYVMITASVPLRAIARQLGVKHDTVMGWRDSPEGKQRLAELAKKRDQELGAVQRTARLALEALVPRAVQRLGDALESGNLNVVVRASREILDRGGLPRTEIHEEHGGDIDLSGLTVEELEQLRGLHAKAARAQGAA